MAINSFRMSLILASCAAAAVVGAAPSAVAAGADPAPVPTPATQPTLAPAEPTSRGTVALPPGGPVATLPQDRTIGGADPFVPFGSDPFVPYGVWTP
ncbi:MAG: hypothetical protein JO280_19150 [Mycobacteriaceae bacterium]|nr:hypothetical protein [Mycobacteriaceae bacterium]